MSMSMMVFQKQLWAECGWVEIYAVFCGSFWIFLTLQDPLSYIRFTSARFCFVSRRDVSTSFRTRSWRASNRAPTTRVSTTRSSPALPVCCTWGGIRRSSRSRYSFSRERVRRCGRQTTVRATGCSPRCGCEKPTPRYTRSWLATCRQVTNYGHWQQVFLLCVFSVVLWGDCEVDAIGYVCPSARDTLNSRIIATIDLIFTRGSVPLSDDQDPQSVEMENTFDEW